MLMLTSAWAIAGSSEDLAPDNELSGFTGIQGFSVPVAYSGNQSNIAQKGDNNQLIAVQAGTSNSIDVSQTGNINIARLIR